MLQVLHFITFKSKAQKYSVFEFKSLNSPRINLVVSEKLAELLVSDVWCYSINSNLFQISEDKNVTMSELTLTAAAEDNGSNLTCRAENAEMSLAGAEHRAVKEASLKLNVMCKLI